MTETRPSGIPIIPDSDALLTQELAEVDGRGRVHLLPRWARRTSWLSVPPTDDLIALMVLFPPGRISLRSWDPDGPRIMERYAILAAQGEQADPEALRAIQDRYQRLQISKERRPYLGHAALQHLGLPAKRGMVSNIWVAIFHNGIDLLGPAYRDAKNLEGHPELENLP